MKSYTDFLNEKQWRMEPKKGHFKFAERDYVKVKKNEKIGYIYPIQIYSNGVTRFAVYTVNFYDGTNQNYKSAELIDATKEEVVQFKFEQETFKYNL
jgi:hypothetical protein